MKKLTIFLIVSFFLLVQSCSDGNILAYLKVIERHKNVSAVNVVTISDTQIAFTWSDPDLSDLTYISITGNPGNLMRTIAIGVETATFSGLSADTAYEFVFKTNFSDGKESLPLKFSTRTLQEVVQPVTNLTAIPRLNGVQLSWTHSASPNISFIRITCTNGLNYNMPYNAGVSTYLISGLTAHSAYNISVYAINSNSVSSVASNASQYAGATGDLWVTGAGSSQVNGLYIYLSAPIPISGEGNNILYSHLPANSYHHAFFDMGPMRAIINTDPPYTTYTTYYSNGSITGSYSVSSGNSPGPTVTVIN